MNRPLPQWIKTALTASIFLTFAPLSLLRAAPEMKPLNVKDFGAKGDGATDDTSAINAAIVAAQKLGAGSIVVLPAGRYKTAMGTDKSILVNGANGLTFQGEGDVTLVSGSLDAPVFRISDSQSVTVRRISIDHEPLGYTQGTITSVDIPKMTCEVSIDPGYPAPDAPTLKGPELHPFVFPEKGYYQLDRYWPKPTQMEKTGENTWHWKLDGPPNIENWPGKRFFMKAGGRSHAFVLRNLRDTTLEDVNYWGGGGEAGFYVQGLQGTTTFRRFTIGVPTGSNRLYSCAGGGQVSGLRGKLLLDHCDFSKIDDDGIDILSNWARIIEQKDKRTLLVQAKVDYRAGDKVELWDWQHKKMRSEALITTATRNPDGTFVLVLDRAITTERVGVGMGMNFSRESIADGIDRLINVSTVGQETIIRDSKFQVFRAKCLNLKAANCTIERCTFRNSFQPAISASPEWYFEEGSTIRNLTVRDSKFVDCNHTNIEIGAAPPTGVPDADPKLSDAPENISHDSTNILIEGNSFTGYGTTPSVFPWWPLGSAIHITNAAHVMIRGNTFGPLSVLAPKDTPKISIERSNDVQLMNNKGISPKDLALSLKKMGVTR